MVYGRIFLTFKDYSICITICVLFYSKLFTPNPYLTKTDWHGHLDEQSLFVGSDLIIRPISKNLNLSNVFKFVFLQL